MLRKVSTAINMLNGFGYGAATTSQEVARLKTFLSGIDRFVDVGANKGLYTSAILRTYPQAKGLLIEPQPYNYDLLVKKFNPTNVEVKPYAITNDTGNLKLFFDKAGSGLASLSKRNLSHHGLELDQHIEVQTQTLDFICKDFKTIDLVKIDVEGHELSVLQSGRKVLDRIKVIQFEFGGANIDTRTFFQDYWYFFQEHQFDLYRITPIGVSKVPSYSERDEIFRTCNYLAVNKK